MDKRDKRIQLLETEVFTHTVFIETLIELLYEMKLIDKSIYSTKIEDKIKLYKKLKDSSQTKEGDNPSSDNPIFYGSHGEA